MKLLLSPEVNILLAMIEGRTLNAHLERCRTLKAKVLASFSTSG